MTELNITLIEKLEQRSYHSRNIGSLMLKLVNFSGMQSKDKAVVVLIYNDKLHNNNILRNNGILL